MTSGADQKNPHDEWAREQIKPLGMFELAKQWADAVKVLGGGNAAGLIAAGAALNSFSQRHDLLFLIKVGGCAFMFGVLTFALAYFLIQIAIFSHDEMLQGILAKDTAKAKEHRITSTGSMVWANRFTISSTLAFFVGCIVGLIVLLRF